MQDIMHCSRGVSLQSPFDSLRRKPHIGNVHEKKEQNDSDIQPMSHRWNLQYDAAISGGRGA